LTKCPTVSFSERFVLHRVILIYIFPTLGKLCTR
jgi:hypothetical protein